MSKVETCRACGHSFTGTTAGDLHRTGDHAVSVGPDRRRCLTVEEMEARGMARNSHGHWMTRPGGGHFAFPGRSVTPSRGKGGGLDHPEDSSPSNRNMTQR